MEAKRCHLCFQDFSRQCDLKNHTAVCNIIYENKRERKRGMVRDKEDGEDITKNITTSQLKLIVRGLCAKITELEKKTNSLEKWVNTKKKRIRPEDWLDKQSPPAQPWATWMVKNIRITDEQWDDFINKNIETVELIQDILRRALFCSHNNDADEIDDTDETEGDQASDEKRINPICGFDKQNELYIYVKNKESKLVWRKMEPVDFRRLLMCVQKAICSKYKNWSDGNVKKISSKQLTHIMRGLSEIPTDESSHAYSKILGTVYKLVKQEFKSVIEFEI